MLISKLQMPQAEDAKYLGLHLDRGLNWKKHIHQAKTTWNSSEQNVLAARQQIATVDRK